VFSYFTKKASLAKEIFNVLEILLEKINKYPAIILLSHSARNPGSRSLRISYSSNVVRIRITIAKR